MEFGPFFNTPLSFTYVPAKQEHATYHGQLSSDLALGHEANYSADIPRYEVVGYLNTVNWNRPLISLLHYGQVFGVDDCTGPLLSGPQCAHERFWPQTASDLWYTEHVRPELWRGASPYSCWRDHNDASARATNQRSPGHEVGKTTHPHWYDISIYSRV